MVKKIRTMYLEQKGFLDERILKFPIIGELSIRQLIIILLPTIIAYQLAHSLGIIPLMIIIITTSFFALFIAKKPTKGFKPEEQLYYLLTQGAYKKPRVVKQKEEVKGIEEMKEAVGEVGEEVNEDEVILIAGVLKDPSTGEPIPNAKIQLNVNGVKVATIRTDANGAYRIHYTFSAPSNTVELLYEDKVIARKTVVVKKQK
jgi:hypothetical protein